jgi:hypothetical protein
MMSTSEDFLGALNALTLSRLAAGVALPPDWTMILRGWADLPRNLSNSAIQFLDRDCASEASAKKRASEASGKGELALEAGVVRVMG